MYGTGQGARGGVAGQEQRTLRKGPARQGGSGGVAGSVVGLEGMEAEAAMLGAARVEVAGDAGLGAAQRSVGRGGDRARQGSLLARGRLGGR